MQPFFSRSATWALSARIPEKQHKWAKFQEKKHLRACTLFVPRRATWALSAVFLEKKRKRGTHSHFSALDALLEHSQPFSPKKTKTDEASFVRAFFATSHFSVVFGSKTEKNQKRKKTKKRHTFALFGSRRATWALSAVFPQKRLKLTNHGFFRSCILRYLVLFSGFRPKNWKNPKTKKNEKEARICTFRL